MSTADDTLTSLSSSILYTLPEFVQELKPSYDVVEGERAIFRCSVKGVPLPRITWLLNGNILFGDGFDES